MMELFRMVIKNQRALNMTETKMKSFNDFVKEKELNEFWGLGDLFKSFLSSFSEPVKQKIESISKSLDHSGKIKDAIEYKKTLISSFDSVVQDSKADIKSAEKSDDVKNALKDFFMGIKGVFVAAKLPLMGILAAKPPVAEPKTEEPVATSESFVNEGIFTAKPIMASDETRGAFTKMMNSSDGKQFDTNYSTFFKAWASEFENDVEKVKSASTDVIDKLMKALSTKVDAYSPDKLKALVELQSKSKEPLSADAVSNAKSDSNSTDAGPIDLTKAEKVKTSGGKDQLLKAAEKSGLKMEKIPGKEEGTYDLIIRGVKV